MSTHKAIGPIEAHTIGSFDVPTRSPGPDEVRIKVEYAAFAAADGHAVHSSFYVNAFPAQVGLVATGTVDQVGKNAERFNEGDIVGVFAQPDADRALQEYVIAPYNRVAKIPSNVSQPEAAAVIDNFVCAWWTIKSSFQLELPESVPTTGFTPGNPSTPILLWGGGTGASIYTLQILRLAGYTNLITTASHHTKDAATSFGATHVFDYNDPDVVSKIKTTAGGFIKYALDPVCTASSLKAISEVVTEPGSKVAVLIPIKAGNLINLNDGGGQLFDRLPDELNPFKKEVEVVPTYTFRWESDAKLKDSLLNKILPALLESGQIKAQKTYVIEEGDLVERVQKAADLTLGNKLRGTKIIVSLK